jgi:hypothetical protein
MSKDKAQGSTGKTVNNTVSIAKTPQTRDDNFSVSTSPSVYSFDILTND